MLAVVVLACVMVVPLPLSLAEREDEDESANQTNVTIHAHMLKVSRARKVGRQTSGGTRLPDPSVVLHAFHDKSSKGGLLMHAAGLNGMLGKIQNPAPTYDYADGDTEEMVTFSYQAGHYTANTLWSTYIRDDLPVKPAMYKQFGVLYNWTSVAPRIAFAALSVGQDLLGPQLGYELDPDVQSINIWDRDVQSSPLDPEADRSLVQAAEDGDLFDDHGEPIYSDDQDLIETLVGNKLNEAAKSFFERLKGKVHAMPWNEVRSFLASEEAVVGLLVTCEWDEKDCANWESQISQFCSSHVELAGLHLYRYRFRGLPEDLKERNDLLETQDPKSELVHVKTC